MRLNKLFLWFFSTLLIGGISALFLIFVIELILNESVFGPYLKQMLLSFTLVMMAELGFFSFLIFNWMCMGMIRSKRGLHGFQIILIGVVVANLIYLYTAKFSGGSLWVHMIIPFLILLVALIVAYLKGKMTQSSAFIPTLFFMVVATTLGAIPSIHSKAGEVPVVIILHGVAVLLICNAWQILQLHRWIGTEKKLD